jgi:hypothetical protein
MSIQCSIKLQNPVKSVHLWAFLDHPKTCLPASQLPWHFSHFYAMFYPVTINDFKPAAKKLHCRSLSHISSIFSRPKCFNQTDHFTLIDHWLSLYIYIYHNFLAKCLGFQSFPWPFRPPQTAPVQFIQGAANNGRFHSQPALGLPQPWGPYLFGPLLTQNFEAPRPVFFSVIRNNQPN